MSRLFKAFSLVSLRGLAQELRRALIARRISRVRRFMERERAMHLQQMAQLRAELDALQLQRTQWRAQP